jgi:ElaB/YqjD/DUF883 family membrane-anchored ribosome-binding protein
MGSKRKRDEASEAEARKVVETVTSAGGHARAGADEVGGQPRVKKAADAVQRAEAELKKARQIYEDVRRKATDRLKSARQKTLGDLIDGTLDLVKRHPGPGVILAGLLGFFFGRLFRR